MPLRAPDLALHRLHCKNGGHAGSAGPPGDATAYGNYGTKSSTDAGATGVHYQWLCDPGATSPFHWTIHQRGVR